MSHPWTPLLKETGGYADQATAELWCCWEQEDLSSEGKSKKKMKLLINSGNSGKK